MSLERIFTLTGRFYNPSRKLTEDEKNQFANFAKYISGKFDMSDLDKLKGRDIMYTAMKFYSYLASIKAADFRRNKDLMDGTRIDGPTQLPDIKQFLINEMQKDIEKEKLQLKSHGSESESESKSNA
jgi:hypothetical protein